MFGIVAEMIAKAGSFAASFGSQACMIWYWDEPKCPKSLIK